MLYISIYYIQSLDNGHYNNINNYTQPFVSIVNKYNIGLIENINICMFISSFLNEKYSLNNNIIITSIKTKKT